MGETVGEKSAEISKKEGSAEIRQVEEDFSSPTPVKKKEPSRIHSNADGELPQLPEKWVQ